MPDQVLNFWFEELSAQDWFSASAELDQKIRKRFSQLHAQAAKGELSHWRNSPRGRLAEIILLDQFSRNIYRGSPQAFTCDEFALKLARELVLRGEDQQLSADEKAFAYMPYMHSEDLAAHAEAEELFKAAGLEENLRYERMHRQIVERFGRYPHRNQILGRKSTEEEIEFLKQPGSSF